MKKAVRFLILITAVSMMFSLFGCAKSKQYDMTAYLDKPAGTLLVDCYSQTVGTPMKQPYDELVMYTDTPDTVLIESYTNGGMEDERCDRYIVPVSAGQDVLDAVKASGMDRWNSRRDTIATCGRAMVCKFPDGEGGYIRVTSDCMPEDGSIAFADVCAAMRGWLRDEYLEK